MKRYCLINKLSPGDVVMLTAAVRDLHKCHPRRFQTEVKTSGGAIWEHNPHVEKITDGREVQEITCAYPLIHRSNRTPHHFIHGFSQDLGGKLGCLNLSSSVMFVEDHQAMNGKASERVVFLLFTVPPPESSLFCSSISQIQPCHPTLQW